MTQTLRAACSIAKSTNQVAKYDRLMKMGNLWKHFPNMAGWHDAEEVEDSQHQCYRLKVNPENYHENGHDTLDLETRARLEVELYYAHREAKTPEERNEYRRIYTQWHPQSYQFRNLRMMMEDDDYDNNRIPNLISYPEEIEIREEEFDEDVNEITATDQLDGCSFTLVINPITDEIINIQLPEHTSKDFWRLVTSTNEQLHHHPDADHESGIDDSEYTPYYSKAAIRTAAAVKDMQPKLGKFSLNKVAEAMLGGAIINATDYTRQQQILTADTILGKGVHTQKQQYKGSEEDDATTNHITLEIDIIFDENLSMLAGLALPTSWTVLIQIKDKTGEVLLHNIQKMIALFEVMGKKVTQIRVDGEK